jgi:hypothetical protein
MQTGNFTMLRIGKYREYEMDSAGPVNGPMMGIQERGNGPLGNTKT